MEFDSNGGIYDDSGIIENIQKKYGAESVNHVLDLISNSKFKRTGVLTPKGL
jgi:hypothetical protein